RRLAMPPGATVPHLRYLLESLDRPNTRARPAPVPWALDDLPRGDTVVLAASDVAADLRHSILHLQEAGFTVLSLLAMSKARSTPLASVSITPGCDLAALLEGRG